MKRESVLSYAILLAAVGLSGCFGVWNGLGSDPMAKIILTKSDWDPRTGENPIAYTSFLGVQDLASSHQMQIDWQTSTTAEACLSLLPFYGAAGAGGGATTGALYPNAAAFAGPAAGVTAAVYALGGCVNGAVTHSYANVYAMGDALEKAMRDHERDPRSKYRDANGKSLFTNLHATAAFTRSRNNLNSPAPGLNARMPRTQWGGPPAGGYPRQYQRYPQYAPPPTAPYPAQPPPQ